MKFCTNCGNQLGDEKFCTKCGAPAPSDVPTPSTYSSSAGGQGRKVMSAVIAVALIVVIAVCFALFGGRSYKTVVKDYVKASVKMDAEKIVSLMPDALVDYIAEEEYDGDKDEMIEVLEDAFESMAERFEKNGADMSLLSKTSYEIVDVEDMDEDDVEDIQEDLDDENIKLKIKEAKSIEMELSVPTTDGDEYTTTNYVTVVKVGRSWYLFFGI